MCILYIKKKTFKYNTSSMYLYALSLSVSCATMWNESNTLHLKITTLYTYTLNPSASFEVFDWTAARQFSQNCDEQQRPHNG